MTLQNLQPEYQAYFSERSTFDSAWREFAHMPEPGPFVPGSPEATLWGLRFTEARVLKARKWIDQYPRLEVTKRVGSKRRMEQPVLKPDFETLHDIRLRLERSLIFIGSELFYIQEIREHERDYALLVIGKDSKHSIVMYSCPDIDLRTPEPQYITLNRVPLFLFRQPSRSQRQGINNENTMGVGVYPKQINTRVCDDISSLVKSMSAPTLPWSPHYSHLLRSMLMPSLRLSKDIAVFSSDGEIFADFRNRALGRVEEDTVVINARDTRRSWVLQAINEAGLRPREAK